MFYRMRMNADSDHHLHELVINLYFNNTLLCQGDREAAAATTDLFRASQQEWVAKAPADRDRQPQTCSGGA